MGYFSDHNASVIAREDHLDPDRYLGDDPPEECPVCGGANSTDEGEPVCADAADFCSVACRDKYLAEQRKADEAYAAALAEEEKLYKSPEYLEWKRAREAEEDAEIRDYQAWLDRQEW